MPEDNIIPKKILKQP